MTAEPAELMDGKIEPEGLSRSEPVQSFNGTARMSKSLNFYAGLALVTAAVLMFQIVETRILSVISWYYLSFFVVSIAMFGLTAGAVWVYLQGERFSGASLSRDLAYYGSIFAVTTAVSLLVQLNLRLENVEAFDFATLVDVGQSWAVLVTAVAVPFFYSGVVVSLALTRSPFPIGRVYGVDLVGAAAGCLGALLLLNLTDGPSAVLWVSAIAALGAWLFLKARIGDEDPAPVWAALFGRPQAIALALAVLAAANGATDFRIRPAYIKGTHVSESVSPIYVRWNSFSRIAQYPLPASEPRMWGPAPNFSAQDWSIEQRVLVIDGDAGTTSYRIEGEVEKAGFLKYDVTNLAYYLPDRGSAAVIGVGGGRDMLSARLFGVERVTGVELNPIIMDLLTEEPGFREFTGIARYRPARSTVELGTWRWEALDMPFLDPFVRGSRHDGRAPATAD